MVIHASHSPGSEEPRLRSRRTRQLDLGVTGEQSSEHVRVIPGDLQELGANVIADEKTQFHPVILARSQSLAMKTDLYSE